MIRLFVAMTVTLTISTAMLGLSGVPAEAKSCT